jgi:carbonic anhydrase/acetyltransferase-like protein (isoleucine patch superfamily)
LHIGDEVVIGHGAIVHGCTLESRCLIGIGATVLDGAVVESGAQVGAGALVPPGMRVPSGSLVVGVPAKVLRPLSAEEVALIPEIAERYVGVKDDYVRSLGPGW